jgi:hypothetical protein
VGGWASVDEPYAGSSEPTLTQLTAFDGCRQRTARLDLTRIKEIKPYFKSGFLLVMPDAAATEIVVSERQARSLRLRIPGL